eukprot:2023157-Pleurochrysis_carterae.AAC.1
MSFDWWSVLRARTAGTTHSGAWRLCTNIGESTAPRSAGCSRMYSAPVSRAARRRRTTHYVIAVTHGRRSAVCSRGSVEESRHGEGRARWRG